MELREVDEDLLEGGTGEGEVRDEALVLQVGQDREDGAQFDKAVGLAERPYFVIDLIRCLNLLGWSLVRSDISDRARHISHDDSMNILQKFSLRNSHFELVSTTVLLLQMARRAKADKAAINHDGNFVAESFCLVHPVSGEHDC